MATIAVNTNFVPSPKAKNRLRVGALLDSLMIPQWASHILEQIENSAVAELAMIITADGPDCVRNRAKNNGTPRLLQLWLELDRILFTGRSAHPDINNLVVFKPANGCLIARHHDDLEKSTSLAAEVRSLQLDVLLDLTSRKPDAQMQDVAKHGLWWFGDDHGLLNELFWVLQRHTVIKSSINIGHDALEANLPGCYSPSDPYSFFRNFGVAAEKRATALERCLAEVYSQRGLPCHTKSLPPELAYPVPGNLETTELIFRLLGRMLCDRWTKTVHREQWFIAFRKVQAKNPDFTLLRPAAGHFYADPFVIDKGGSTYIFFEDYCYDAKKAVISFVVIDPDGSCSAPEAALEEEYHLSYPHLFSWRNEIYLLPETKSHKTIQVYRAVDFPSRWELSHVLMQNISAVDSTLLQHEGKFWLFTSGVKSRDPWFAGDDELFLFFADSLDGRWTAHPKNPIVADVRNCRSAGQIMQWGNQLIRPAQDCSTRYGSAVVFNHIEVLSQECYRETPIARISPDWLPGNYGTHTFNCSARYEVLDGRTVVGKLWDSRTIPAFELATPAKPLFSRESSH